eukprot:27322-Hanusia_phi.AAC.1
MNAAVKASPPLARHHAESSSPHDPPAAWSVTVCPFDAGPDRGPKPMTFGQCRYWKADPVLTICPLDSTYTFTIASASAAGATQTSSLSDRTSANPALGACPNKHERPVASLSYA